MIATVDNWADVPSKEELLSAIIEFEEIQDHDMVDFIILDDPDYLPAYDYHTDGFDSSSEELVALIYAKKDLDTYNLIVETMQDYASIFD